MSDWYYLQGSQRLGPHTLEQMRALSARGLIGPQTKVWTAGFADWKDAATAPDVLSAAPETPPTDAGPAWDTVSRVSDALSGVTGTDRIDSSHLTDLFSEVLKRHDETELERVFASGLTATTPALSQLDVRTPCPWVYSRLLGFFGIAFAILYIAWIEFEGSDRLIPGLILIGSFASPLAAAVFVYECNIPRNVSLFIFARLFTWGGVIAILLTFALFPLVSTMAAVIGPSVAGLVEEPGKLAAVVLLANAARFRWTLNGMCLGAAVGAGFAAFESAGYALESLAEHGGEGLIHSLAIRGLLAPFGHVVWTAICAGALWRVRQGKPFDWAMLRDRRCLSPIVSAMVLHALWNSPLPAMLPLYLGYFAIGAVGWIIAIGMMHEAIREIRDAKDSAERTIDAGIMHAGGGA